MAPLLDERSRRRWAASEARMIGHGGVSAVADATGLARRTIYRGLEDLQDRASVENDRIRRQGGGRKSRITEDPTLLSDLEALLEPATRGDPMRRQLWTVSYTHLRAHETRHDLVCRLLLEKKKNK